ncbi:MAG: putative toxin-antitoxin system toxin component, PIN family [Actinomycetota bacterium]|nr:putative toxin-antitoxin system toxin component, PIN family [Actinomycetota bacterium]
MSSRIVIGTSVLVSGLRSSRGASHRLLELVGSPDFDIVLSVPLALEYEDVAKRHSSELGLSHADVDQLMEYLCGIAHLQEIHYLWRPLLRDPKDDHVLELAVGAGCDVIVTHNIRDFTGTDTLGVAAIRPGEFLRRIGVTS